MTTFEKNKNILEENGVQVRQDRKGGEVELECYTPAGEDMIITLDELTAQCLCDYIKSFDINENVLMWWQHGKSSDVPFDNIKEHYEDYEEWLDGLMDIADEMD